MIVFEKYPVDHSIIMSIEEIVKEIVKLLGVTKYDVFFDGKDCVVRTKRQFLKGGLIFALRNFDDKSWEERKGIWRVKYYLFLEFGEGWRDKFNEDLLGFRERIAKDMKFFLDVRG